MPSPRRRSTRTLALLVAAGAAIVLTGCTAAAAASLQPATSPTTPSASALPAPTETESPIAAAGPARVVTIGDSIMSGFGLDSSQAWPALLGDQESATVTNLACSGAGFVAVGSCGADYGGQLAAAVRADPELVIIQSSDNDQYASESAIRAATTQTVAALHAALPDARIVGMSTLWDQSYAAPSTISISSDALKSAVASVGGTWIDLGQPLAGHADWLQSDSEHPTVAGQRVLLAAITAAFARAGLSF